MAVIPPPAKAGPTGAEVEAGDALPQGPILYHVTRDSAGTTMVPVGIIADGELQSISIGDDPQAFGERFITAYLRSNAEFTLFRHGRRAGTLVVDSATVPAGGFCRPLPRATGSVELTGAAGEATEFLAMARTQAPEGRMLPGGEIQVEPRMQVVGNILAEQTLRSRGAPLPDWRRARRQIQPFPVSEARDLGFTATFLIDDELAVGNDDQGSSLYVVYTPRAQGYDTVYVDYTSYTAEGKAAPRTIDFLDWDRDGAVELLLEVFGTENSWYAAVGSNDDEWSQIFEDRCDPGARTLADEPAADTTGADTAAARPAGPQPGQPQPRQSPPTQGPPTQDSARQPPRRQAATAPAVADTAADGDPIRRLQPRVQLADPGAPPSRRDTQPDTSGAGAPS